LLPNIKQANQEKMQLDQEQRKKDFARNDKKNCLPVVSVTQVHVLDLILWRASLVS
jgi:hypothetical protein